MKTYSISKKNILKSSKLLDKVFTSGKKISSPSCSLYYLKTKSGESFRVAFSVGKKTHNLAVNRNKIKRRLRNIINDAIKEISIKLNYSYLVIAKPTMLNNEFKNIKETLFQEFKKIK